MEMRKDTPVLTFTTLTDWLAWLEKHHADTPAVWLKFAKKGSGIQTIGYKQAREGALIYGWIDGVANTIDETFYVQRMTPRRPKGNWSAINRELIEEYIRDGKMKPSGMKEVEAAKADGRWERAMLSPSNITVPPDFQAALDKNPKAAAAMETISKSARYSFLYQIMDAKRPETRARRIEKFVGMLEEGKTLN